jgi:hypothetical protein
MDAHACCPMMDKECHSILKTLQESHSLLWGSHMWIHADHKSLIYHNIKSQHILNWVFIIEEFALNSYYKPTGINNILLERNSGKAGI